MRYAISGDSDFIQKIKASEFSGYVHSIFNRTVNIQSLENGELYTVACQEIDNGPNTLVIQVERFNTINLSVNDQVYTENNFLHIANKLTIAVDKAALWESILPEYPQKVEILNRNSTKMRDYIDHYGIGGGMKKSNHPTTPFEIELSRLLEERTGLLLTELFNNRHSEAIEKASKLIGLGPGLTPSGDDFLVGLFTILNLPKSPTHPLKDFCLEVVKLAKPLTNEISYMAMQKASIGKVRESIISLIHSILYGTEEDLILSLNKVLKIGSSSGTDIALGILAGLEANKIAGGKV
ncbi:DUF2877 domain-containing protein [Pseudoneobacillus rhizosphaerae]|uniref:DUF2877 domain-containing protein n=1 Tax=Pseudoneobacillus rhizosphaerae TaxID=2880968 RepID=A0A9C7GC30_9BACI|nr:DUF2877 domain-containing protein [Pseudoneobacillus rhizosphaerae]CAG9609583.1 hypothetical protein NEOCIP111885_03326 [Pseudoneobacillus rhizosphaerae]